MISPEQLIGEEWLEWYRLTPAQRWQESEKLWQTYLALGGSLDPEPDTQSPFFDARAPRPRPAHGRTGLRVLRRGRLTRNPKLKWTICRNVLGINELKKSKPHPKQSGTKFCVDPVGQSCALP